MSMGTPTPNPSATEGSSSPASPSPAVTLAASACLRRVMVEPLSDHDVRLIVAAHNPGMDSRISLHSYLARTDAGGMTDWSVPPGDILREMLTERGITQTELARRMGLSLKHINRIVGGHVTLTAPTALLLERELGLPALFWMNLEAAYSLYIARVALTPTETPHE